VRRGTTFVFVVGAGAIAGLFALRACSNKPAQVTKTPANTARSGPTSRAPTATGKASRVAPITSASAASGPAHDKTAQGKVVFFSSWGGSHKDQLGRDRPQEGSPMGPMSLAHDSSGKIYVLDQINHRVVRRNADGTLDRTSEMALRGAEDIAVGKDGSAAVLDRILDKAVALYDPSGEVKGQIPLEGPLIDDTVHVTGVVVDGDDVYVEREHGPLVKIGGTDGSLADPRVEIPGRPTRDGLSYINAGITDAPQGRAYVSSIERATGQHRFTRELRFKSEIRHIVLLDSDTSGTIYFGVELHEDPGTDWVVLQCLDPLKGVPIGSADLPANTLPEQTWRDLTVLDDGGVIYAVRSEDGVTYRRYDCGG